MRMAVGGMAVPELAELDLHQRSPGLSFHAHFHHKAS